jgi:hypothetical protein
MINLIVINYNKIENNQLLLMIHQPKRVLKILRNYILILIVINKSNQKY